MFSTDTLMLDPMQMASPSFRLRTSISTTPLSGPKYKMDGFERKATKTAKDSVLHYLRVLSFVLFGCLEAVSCRSHTNAVAVNGLG
jgi:hypothetical protein